ncbi:hypothetical protein GQ607_013473 [Colletotrichum asianum]|uniref:Uncharacterized protein n=1 Tax=Colletotrichum asianum TaxID=702518 RepID=A0A8H3ZGU9_9PEZI|nr:hypothetical protein GQ607_013473 [Colletotrichum asianum]
MGVSPGKKNIALTRWCYTDAIPEEEDLAKLVRVRLCADLLHAQLVHAQLALKAGTEHRYKGVMGIKRVWFTILDQEDTLKLVDNDLCVDLLNGQFFPGYPGGQ